MRFWMILSKFNLVTKVGTLHFLFVINIIVYAPSVIDFTVYTPSEKIYVIVLIYTDPKCVMCSCVALSGFLQSPNFCPQ